MEAKFSGCEKKLSVKLKGVTVLGISIHVFIFPPFFLHSLSALVCVSSVFQGWAVKENNPGVESKNLISIFLPL